MKKYLIFLIFLITLISCTKQESQHSEKEYESSIRIAVIESFLPKQNLKNINRNFSTREKTDIQLDFYPNYKSFKRTVPQKNTDIIIGLRDYNSYHYKLDSLFIPLQSLSEKSTILDSVYLPFCYNFLSFTVNKEMNQKVPRTLALLTNGDLNKQFIMFHPDSTQIGLESLYFTVSTFGEYGFRHFWRGFKENISHIEADTNAGLDKFMASDSPFILSYLTLSKMLKKEFKVDNYESFTTQEGCFRIQMGAAILKHSKNMQLSKKYLAYLLKDKTQSLIENKLYMFPINQDSDNPNYVSRFNLPQKRFNRQFPKNYTKDDLEIWMKKWKKEVVY